MAAAGIGIGLSSLTRPQQQNEQKPTLDVPATHENDIVARDENVAGAAVNATQEEVIYNTFFEAGWPAESARIFSSLKTEFRESNSTSVHYIQTFPSGMINDVRISISPGEKYTPVEADKIITQFGTVLYQKDAKLFSSQEMYATKISYFIPYDNFDTELIQELGWDDPYFQVSTFQNPWIRYASATTEITGVGIESTNTLIKPSGAPPGASDMDARLADAAEDVTRFERERIYESSFKEGREISNLSPNDPVILEVNKRLSPEAQALAREQAEYLSQETKQMIDELKSRHELAESTKINKKWLSRVTGLGGTALAIYELNTILEQHSIRSAWLSYYEDCVKNPNIPRYGGDTDTGYVQSIEQIETARTDLRVNTAAMYGNSIINTVAGLMAHNPGIEIATMLASSASQARLDHTAQNDIMAPLKQLGSPCKPQPPCEEPDREPTPPPVQYGDHTPGPDEPGFYYTLGPRESFEPPERQQCKPLPPNQVRVVISKFDEGDDGAFHKVTFEATANVTNVLAAVVDGVRLEVPGWFVGNGTGYYHENRRYYTQSPGLWCDVEIKGDTTLVVEISPHKSGDQPQLAQVSANVVGDLPISVSDMRCDNGRNGDATTGGGVTVCYFEVDKKGGHYRSDYRNTGPNDEDCELFMGPLTDIPQARVVP